MAEAQLADEPTARNSKWRRAVAVGVVDHDFGNLVYVDFQALFPCQFYEIVGVAFFEFVEYF